MFEIESVSFYFNFLIFNNNIFDIIILRERERGKEGEEG